MKAMISLGLLVAGLSLSSWAEAYNYRTCSGNTVKWPSNSKTMRAASVSFPSGSSWLSSLSTSISRVNQNPSKFTFGLLSGDTSVGMNNGQSEIWFSSDSQHSPAVAYTWSECYWLFGWHHDINEVDVVFYNQIPYTTTMTNPTATYSYGGGSRTFQTTAIHELGHAAGLLHEADEYNIMGSDWTHITRNGNTIRAYLGEDAGDGLVAMYGTRAGAFEDVSLTHFKRTGSSGEYSTHGQTKLYNCSTGAELSSYSANGMRRYYVNKGQCVRLELTYENNGKNTQYPQVGYYLSTNNYISTGDTYLGATNFTLSRDNVLTYQRNVTIPSSTSSGYYYLGAVIDRNNAIGEAVESNNAAYLQVRVL